MRGPTHVLLHQPHARGGLDVEPARIEADPFADDGDTRMAPVAPFELDQPRRTLGGRGAADRGDHRIALVERRPGSDPHLGAALRRHFAHRRLEFGGTEVDFRKLLHFQLRFLCRYCYRGQGSLFIFRSSRF